MNKDLPPPKKKIKNIDLTYNQMPSNDRTHKITIEKCFDIQIAGLYLKLFSYGIYKTSCVFYIPEPLKIVTFCKGAKH